VKAVIAFNSTSSFVARDLASRDHSFLRTNEAELASTQRIASRPLKKCLAVSIAAAMSSNVT